MGSTSLYMMKEQEEETFKVASNKNPGSLRNESNYRQDYSRYELES